MNCKPGDLAIVVAARAEKKLIGLVVEVVHHIPKGAGFYSTRFGAYRISADSDVWLVRHGSGEWGHSDSRLRPIRPGDLEDETPTVRELEAA